MAPSMVVLFRAFQIVHANYVESIFPRDKGVDRYCLVRTSEVLKLRVSGVKSEKDGARLEPQPSQMGRTRGQSRRMWREVSWGALQRG